MQSDPAALLSTHVHVLPSAECVHLKLLWSACEYCTYVRPSWPTKHVGISLLVNTLFECGGAEGSTVLGTHWPLTALQQAFHHGYIPVAMLPSPAQYLAENAPDDHTAPAQPSG